MIYQLPSGRVIEITLEQYLEMSDDDIEFFIAYEVGEYSENPFYASVIKVKTKEDEEEFFDEDDLDDFLDIDIDFIIE